MDERRRRPVGYDEWERRFARDAPDDYGLVGLGAVLGAILGVGGLGVAAWRLAHGGPHGTAFWVAVACVLRGGLAAWAFWSGKRSDRAA